MAFGLKYELLMTTRKGRLFKTKIYFDGYTGAQIDRNVPTNAFKLRKDKAAVVRGTSFEFAIREEVDFEFLEFYTNSSKKVKVELYDPSNTLIWVGYNLPQQYQVPYAPPPANVSFTATDGLGLLKTEPFTLTGRNSQLAIIRHCVDKIGLSLGYSIASGIFESRHDHNISSFAQTYLDAEIFDGNNCYEVLEKVLGPIHEITQSKGRWKISCVINKKSTRMLYTSAGVYETTEAAPAVLDLGYPGAGIEVTPRGTLQMGLEPGAKQVKIKHDYGKKYSLLENSNFAQYSSGAFPGWSVSGTFTPEQYFNEKGPYLFIPGRSNTQEFLYGSFEVAPENGQFISISLEMGVLGSHLYGGLTTNVKMALTVWVKLTAPGETDMYLSEDGQWYNYDVSITKTMHSRISGLPFFNLLEIRPCELPFFGNIVICLGRYHSLHEVNDSSWTIPGVAYQNLKVDIFSNTQPIPNGVNVLAEFTDSSEPNNLSDIELEAADAPGVINADKLFNKVLRLGDDSLTELWEILGVTGTRILLEIIGLILASENKAARQKLTGDIKGAAIAFDSIIKHSYNDNREFEIAEGTWDIFEEVFSVTLLELLPWSDETVVFTEAENLNSSGTGSEGNTGGGSAVVSVEVANMSAIGKYFEIVNAETEDAYIRVKLPFSSDYEITAWSDEGQFPPSIFESMPYATADVKGAIKVGNGLSITNGVLSATGSVGFNEAGNYAPTGTWAFTQAPTVGGVVVSLAGHTHDDRYFTESETTSAINAAVAALVDSAPGTLDTLHELATALGDDPNFATTVSTALGNRMLTSHVANGITGTNITNWNSAFGWGNHASAGYVTGTPWTSMGYLTSQTSHADVLVDGDFTSNGLMNRTGAGTYSIVTDYLTSGHTSTYNHSQFQTAYSHSQAAHQTIINGTGLVSANGTAIGFVTDYLNSDHVSAYNHFTGTPWTGLGYITSAALAPYATLASPTFTGVVTLPGAASLRYEYNSHSASRRWWISTDQQAYGDFQISTESTKGGGGDLARMYINPSGNIGIGTTTPSSKFDLFDNTTLGSTIGNYQRIHQLRGWADGNDLVRSEGTLRLRTGTDWYRAGWFSFVHVSGYADIPMSSSRMWEMVDIYDYKRVWGNGASTLLELNGYYGSLTMTGTITASGEVTAYSDARIKTNILNTLSVMDRFEKIRVVDYNRTDTTDNKRRTGLIAQELRELFPQYVLGDESKGMLSINYAEMVSVCIKAIQELRAEVKQLRS